MFKEIHKDRSKAKYEGIMLRANLMSDKKSCVLKILFFCVVLCVTLKLLMEFMLLRMMVLLLLLCWWFHKRNGRTACRSVDGRPHAHLSKTEVVKIVWILLPFHVGWMLLLCCASHSCCWCDTYFFLQKSTNNNNNKQYKHNVLSIYFKEQRKFFAYYK